jgi:hypothetical protein
MQAFVNGEIDPSTFEESLADLTPTVDERACRDALLGLLKNELELFVGGDESPYMLQFQAATSENNADIMCSVLLPEEEVCVHWCGRGLIALNTAILYWRERANAPVLVSRSDSYHYAIAYLRDKEWSRGPFCLQHVQKLQTYTDEGKFVIDVPELKKEDQLL